MYVRTSRSTVMQTDHRTARQSRRAAFLVSAIVLTVLAGCASRQTRAPVTDLSNGANQSLQSSSSATTYVVKPGDTLYKIAQAHDVDVASLVRINNISDPSQLRVGQTLKLTGSATSRAPAASAVHPASSTHMEPEPLPPPPPPTEPATPSRAADAGVVSWGWPASGKIIQGFNANTKGIDIAGAVGAPVLAAGAGKVMYAGNGVRGLGNLILLGHAGGFITAYAHNDKLLVKTGQTVKKGAKIATIGQTDTTSPRLHFEIRRSGTPVNPLAYLPPR